MPTMSIDYGQLQAFFVAERLPGIQNLWLKSEPTINMLYSVAMAGSLNGAAEIKDYAKAAKNPTNPNFNKRFLGGTLFFESASEYLAVGGTVNGSGAQAISNNPQDQHVVARWRFNVKSTPLAIATDQWLASQNAGGKVAQTKKLEGLISAKVGSALKTQIQALSTDLFSTNTDEETGIISLKALTGVSASDTTTYGGISRSTISQWLSNYATYSSADSIDPLSSYYLPIFLGGKIDTLCDNGSMLEDLVIIMGSTVFSNYRKCVMGVPGSASTTPPNSGQFNIDGGRNFPYAGLYLNKVPVIRDQRCGATDIFILDTATSIMVGLANALFKLSDWQLSEGSTQEFARLTTISNVVGTSPRNDYYIAAA